MEPREIPFIWSAEVIVDRGPVDDPLFVDAAVSATMTDSVGSYGQHLLEENAVSWLADRLGTTVDNMTVVSLHWSMLDDLQTYTPPPAPE